MSPGSFSPKGIPFSLKNTTDRSRHLRLELQVPLEHLAQQLHVSRHFRNRHAGPAALEREHRLQPLLNHLDDGDVILQHDDEGDALMERCVTRRRLYLGHANEAGARGSGTIETAAKRPPVKLGR